MKTRRLAFVFFILFLLYYLNANFKPPNPLSSLLEEPVHCNKSRDHINSLLNLTREVHDILDELGINHWLMYGSLWGIVRGYNKPLPWDHDVDIGIRGDDPNYVKLSRKQFLDAFTKRRFLYIDFLDRNCIIHLYHPGSNADAGPHLDIFVFYEYFGTMKRAGWITWLAPIRYNLFDAFPAKVIEFPLPKARFGDLDLCVPRDIMRVLRHEYPYNWWKVSKPGNCID